MSEDICHYLPNHNTSITAEYLPPVLNTVADRESKRKKLDSSEWLLHPKVFQVVFQLCHQLPQHIAWHPDSYSQETDAMIQIWNIGLSYAFPLFIMISRVLLKIKQKCIPLLILTVSVWSSPTVPRTLKPLCQETSTAAPGKRNSDKPKKYCPPCDGGFATVNLHRSAISVLRELLMVCL